MFDRNYFGMMMVETGQADFMISGAYSGSKRLQKIAEKVVGIRPTYNHFATMHILNTKRGTFFMADTTVNREVDEETLFDITRLARNSVEYFAHDPIMAMVSYSNFGSHKEKGA